MIAGAFLAISFVLGACSGCEPTSKRPPHDAADASGPRPTFTLFALADLRGEIEPCGCTTDPWGDISRTAQLVTDARALGPTMFVDAGSTLYAEPNIPAHLAESAKLKASLIADLYNEVLRADAIGMGAGDLAFGSAGLLLPRITNVTADGVIATPYKVVDVAGHNVGVVSVLSPGAIAGIVEIPDPADALTKFSAAARSEGAELVVALLQSPMRKDAQRVMAMAKGVDIAIVGLGNDAPEPKEISRRPERIGDAWVVFPAAKGQTLVRFDITVRAGSGSGLADAIGPNAASLAIAAIDKELATIKEQLAAFRVDVSADKAFVARKEAELVELGGKRTALEQSPLQIPAGGSYFTFDLVPINKKLACDAVVVEKKIAFDKASGHANFTAAAAMPPVEIPNGQATYVGIAECVKCHAPAVEFWKTTRHARAWKTLEDVGKEFNYDCVSCHVSGWMEPGGSTLAKNGSLRDVQCETCHGPGSVHVAKGGGKGTMMRSPPDDFCANKCHTPEHSDTFDRTPYLRDILGPGHGEAARRTLGDGTTGRQLRSAGLAKAGAAIGKGCPK